MGLIYIYIFLQLIVKIYRWRSGMKVWCYSIEYQKGTSWDWGDKHRSAAAWCLYTKPLERTLTSGPPWKLPESEILWEQGKTKKAGLQRHLLSIILHHGDNGLSLGLLKNLSVFYQGHCGGNLRTFLCRMSLDGSFQLPPGILSSVS